MRVLPTTHEELVSVRAGRYPLHWLVKKDLRIGLLWAVLFGGILLSAMSAEALSWSAPEDPARVTAWWGPQVPQSQFNWLMSLYNYACTVLLSISLLSALWLAKTVLLGGDAVTIRKLTILHLWLYYFTLACIVGVTALFINEYGTNYLSTAFWVVFIVAGLLCVVHGWKQAHLLSRPSLLVIHCCLVLYLFWVYYGRTIGNWVDVIQ